MELEFLDRIPAAARGGSRGVRPPASTPVRRLATIAHGDAIRITQVTAPSLVRIRKTAEPKHDQQRGGDASLGLGARDPSPSQIEAGGVRPAQDVGDQWAIATFAHDAINAATGRSHVRCVIITAAPAEIRRTFREHHESHVTDRVDRSPLLPSACRIRSE